MPQSLTSDCLNCSDARAKHKSFEYTRESRCHLLHSAAFVVISPTLACHKFAKMPVDMKAC